MTPAAPKLASRLLLIVLGPTTAACSGEASGPDRPGGNEMGTAGAGPLAEQEEQEPGVRDVSPSPPELGPDSMRVELAEQRVEPGEEIQFCHYLEPTTEDHYLVDFTQYQGVGGHHLIVFQALEPKAPGTIETCGTEEMATLIPLFLSSDFTQSKFPEGMALRIPAGTQMVIQQHYVNTAPTAIVSRDVGDLTFIPASDVEMELGFYGISDLDFVISPSSEPQTVTVECEPGIDMTWLMTGPHMHENGTRISLAHESGGTTRMLVDIPDWDDEYRDIPPVSDYQAAPVEIKAGDKLRLSCTFQNETGEELRFPSEMCAAYGYFYPGDEVSLWGCTPSGAVE